MFILKRFEAVRARFHSEEKGAAAVEFAILVPVMAAALILMVDIGEAIAAKFDVERKMRLAIEGVLRYGTDTDKVLAFANASGNAAFPGKTQAAENDAALQVDAYYLCRGANNSVIQFTTSANATCPNYESWYKIQATSQFTAIFGKTFDLSTVVDLMAE